MARISEDGHGGNEYQQVTRADFPPDFVFGVATSAFQVEGASTIGHRTDSIWDTFVDIPGKVQDGSNGKFSCDHYHRYKDDIKLIADLGFKAYRFSISWSRIVPDPLTGAINKEGISFYNKIIDSLLENGITPFVTLYHWDLPQILHEKIGGWLNPKIVAYFTDYAEACFMAFGDRVKYWITMNEPVRFALLGYGLGVHAPGRSSDRKDATHGNSSTEPYIVVHNVLMAHAATVRLYRRQFKNRQGGIIGVSVDCEWPEPLTGSVEDANASQRYLEFSLSWFLDPIYFGAYPSSMCESVGDRLPRFNKDEIDVVQGSTDFVGFNHYFSAYVTRKPEGAEKMTLVDGISLPIGWHTDVNTILQFEKNGKAIGEKGASPWMHDVPWGFAKLLKWLTERYNRPPLFVLENGFDDENDPALSKSDFLHDKKRIKYFQGYLYYLAQAIREGADVRGYFAWALLDNFEWQMGYTKRFGVVFVDFAGNLERSPKDSALWFRNFLADQSVQE